MNIIPRMSSVIVDTLNLKGEMVIHPCSKCGQPLPLFKVHEGIWYSLPKECHKKVLCIECMTSMIDRTLHMEDFQLGIPVNDWIFNMRWRYKYIHLMCKIFRCIKFVINELKHWR